MSEEIAATAYDRVIPTGWLTAYGRTFSDIPYAQQVFAEIEHIREAHDGDVLATMKDTSLAPQFEARHKLLSKLTRASHMPQVLEVAAGLSTRGLELAADPILNYVEVDLPLMVADKQRIVATLQRHSVVPQRPNLHFAAGSAVDDSLMLAAQKFLTPNPVAVVNEGLLRYLSFDEKEAYVQNVEHILRQHGGVWITSDISLPAIIYKEDDVMAERRKKISALTGINVANNLFKDEADAKRFFEARGFDVTSHSLLEVIDGLASPDALSMPRDYVKAIIGSAVIFVMKLRNADA